MSEIQYSPDKPKDCKYCYWYEKRKGCTFGEHCSYAVPHPCIGYCMKEVIKSVKDKDKAK